jgi:hypothetical protein
MPQFIIHIVHEMKYLGPVFIHQIYPFESFMIVLRKFVHNQSCLKDFMGQGWIKEEVIVFVVDYMDLEEIGKPIWHHEGCLTGKGTICHTTFNVNNFVTYYLTQFTVL